MNINEKFMDALYEAMDEASADNLINGCTQKADDSGSYEETSEHEGNNAHLTSEQCYDIDDDVPTVLPTHKRKNLPTGSCTSENFPTGRLKWPPTTAEVKE